MRVMVTAWVLWVCLAAAGLAATKEMSVSVMSGSVKATPHPLGKEVGRLEYTTVVDVSEEQAGWCRIATKDGKVSGWMPAKSLAPGRLKLASGADAAAGVSMKETALAGKGFTKQVEDKYREKNPKVSFAWVDRMLGFRVGTQEVADFLKAGGLGVQEGGRP
jgi:hypothetical protein